MTTRARIHHFCTATNTRTFVIFCGLVSVASAVLRWEKLAFIFVALGIAAGWADWRRTA